MIQTRRISPLIALLGILTLIHPSGQLLAGNTEQPKTHSNTELGLSKATPINVCKPEGEHAFIKRLRCPDGSPPSYARGGSVGTRVAATTEKDREAMMRQMMSQAKLKKGEKDFHMVDMYNLKCADETYELFLDMYHCDEPLPQQAPPGFDLVPAVDD